MNQPSSKVVQVHPAEKPRHIALLVESSRIYGRRILRGIARYAHLYERWSFFTEERELHSGVPDWIQEWKGDGIIARVQNQQMANELLKKGCPVIDVLGQVPLRGVTVFDTSSPEAGVLAADFFVNAGFGNFAYCGYRGIPYSEARGEAFRNRLRSQNFKVLTPPLLATVSGDARDIQGTERKGWAITEVLAEWLVKQSFPLAVFACNDTRAQQVLNACREGGIRVPDQIAVLGVDNDDVLCDLCEPPLSSIELDAEGLGYRAAALLSRLMQGLAVGDETLSVQTVRLIERVSTDIIAIEDATTVAAMRYIRDHVCEGIATKDVVSHMGCARSNLDVRFHRWLHRSVRAEIHRQRMEIVLRYLEKTDLTIHQIAERTGFATSAHLCRLFQKRFGISPTEHRSKRTTGQLI